jgi:radical SAM protein with 4Fe4S-binding SPASM domain
MGSKIRLFGSLARALPAYLKKNTKCAHLPTRAWIDVSSVCNLRCQMCPNRMCPPSEKGFMDYNLFVKAIDQLSEFAFDVNLFLSGEPLLHPEIVRMISYAKLKGLKTVINTNATKLTGDLSAALLSNNLDRIVFSFDTPDRERYESIRAGAQWESTLLNIREFLAMKKKNGFRSTWTVLQMIEFSDSKSRQAERNAYHTLFSGLPVDEFKYIRPHTFGGLFPEYASIKGKHYTPCTFLWYSVNILSDGRIVPCCLDVRGQCTLGNLRNETLSDVWNNQKYQDLRTKIAKGRYAEIGLCRDCDILWKNTFSGIPTRYLWNFIKENFFR